MIVLDTNVVSEVTRLRPDRIVDRWLRSVDPRQLCITATVLAESTVGVGVMPDGKRKRTLASRLDVALDALIENRILPFDADAARAYAVIHTERRRTGRPMSIGDAQIAAVCLVHNATLATRNIKDFVGCGIRLVNPWDPTDGS